MKANNTQKKSRLRRAGFVFWLIGESAEAVLDCNGNRNSSAYHRVVAHSEEAHHLNVSGYGRGACELSVRMHAAHGVGHTIGSGTCSHVIGMQGSACAAARSNGEVLLALLGAFLLVGSRNGMLESGRVGGVTGDGNVNTLLVHDCNAFADVVSAVAANVGALTIGVGDFLDDGQLACKVVKLSLNIGEAVDSGDDLSGVLAETVEDNAERLLTNLVRYR